MQEAALHECVKRLHLYRGGDAKLGSGKKVLSVARLS